MIPVRLIDCDESKPIPGASRSGFHYSKFMGDVIAVARGKGTIHLIGRIGHSRTGSWLRASNSRQQGLAVREGVIEETGNVPETAVG
jgi:hypothetical protein